MKPGRKSLAAMLLLLVISAAVVWFGMGDEMKGARDMRFGIDIRGGVEAVFEPVGLDRAPYGGRGHSGPQHHGIQAGRQKHSGPGGDG